MGRKVCEKLLVVRTRLHVKFEGDAYSVMPGQTETGTTRPYI